MCKCGNPSRVDKNGYVHTSCNTCRRRRQRASRAARIGRSRVYPTRYWTRRRKWIVGKRCEFCGTTDDLTVDHMVMLRDDPSLKNLMDTSNWRALCRPCHDAYTREVHRALAGALA